MDATKSDNGEKLCNNIHSRSSQPFKVTQNKPLSSKNRGEDLRQPKVMEDIAQAVEDINEDVTNKNREEEKGTSKRKTRGKTLCKTIHGRTLEEHEEVTFNEDGQPIGPSDKVVSDLSLFLGTLARNSTFCPLIYTNWSGMSDKNIRRFWRYTNVSQKFVLPIEARDWVETTVRDAWRRYKHKIKKDHFLKYSNLTERLKHRPPKVPESHFRKLCEYWNSKPQAISERNTRNRAQLKWVHQMGPKKFSLAREKFLAKEKREPTQAEIFVETQKGNKGKPLDVETEKVISQLQEMVENGESDTEAFEAIFGKERPGMEEINALKKAHNKEVSVLVENFEDKIGKLKHAFKTLMQHCNPQINMESIEDLLGFSHGDANGSPNEATVQMHSSTSTHAPCLEKQYINGDGENDNELFQDDDVGDKFQDDKFEMYDIDNESEEDALE
uniref:Uncharacterized protein LOC101509362 n=1 Tax=Cicer arietinum TaxID=3827 RepID=A0A1S3EER0_CICAR|nr:uncharacterized protein LOC101509362 [Cicer arietinum]